MGMKSVKALSALATVGVLALSSDALAARGGGQGSNSSNGRGQSVSGTAAGRASMDASSQVTVIKTSMAVSDSSPVSKYLNLMQANASNPVVAKVLADIAGLSQPSALQKKAALASISLLGAILDKQPSSIGQNLDLSIESLENQSEEIQALGAALTLASNAVRLANAEPTFVEGKLVALMEQSASGILDGKKVEVAMMEAIKALKIDKFNGFMEVVKNCNG